jgi:hypothetical protein
MAWALTLLQDADILRTYEDFAMDEVYATDDIYTQLPTPLTPQPAGPNLRTRLTAPEGQN